MTILAREELKHIRSKIRILLKSNRPEINEDWRIASRTVRRAHQNCLAKGTKLPMRRLTSAKRNKTSTLDRIILQQKMNIESLQVW